MESLGLRNRNPFNLRSNHVAWLGKVCSYKGFCVFKDLDYGIRAGLINLATQIRRSNSLCDLVYRYAPPSENDSQAYYNFLYKKLGNDWYSIVHDLNHFLVLAYNIAKYEGNVISYSSIRRVEKRYHIFEKHLAKLSKPWTNITIPV